ncbi:hypothetical protein EMCRGX_G026081 [Ephydatia muelleri]
MSSHKVCRPRREIKPPSSSEVVDIGARFGVSVDDSDSSDTEFKPDNTHCSESGASDISEDACGGSPDLSTMEGDMEEGESGAGEKGGNEEKGEESCSTAEGGELALPPKRSRRRTALSVHLVDLNELSVKLGIPLEDDASDSEFEPSVEDLASDLDTGSSSSSEDSSGGEGKEEEGKCNMDTEAGTTASPVPTAETDSKSQEAQGDGGVLLCAVCLGDSESGGDIVACDCCGIAVHEGCYGVPDDEGEDQDAKSDISSFTTIPWFCDPCKAGVKSPVCELCPNTGGLYKETITGGWTHMVCCLYTPGVEYVSPTLLSGITLDRLPRSKWGAKVCQLCENEDAAKTGVCIGCDAGFCKSTFHATCAQKQGLLCEAEDKDDDTEIADPYFAHCKPHADKEMSRKARRAFVSVMARQKNFKFDATDERNMQYLEQAKKDYIVSFKKMQDYYHLGQNGTDGQHSSEAGNDSSVASHRKIAQVKHMNGSVLQPVHGVGSKRKATSALTKKVAPALTREFADYYNARREQIQSLLAENRVLAAANEELRKLEQDTQRQLSNTEEKLACLKAEGAMSRGQAVDLYTKLFRLANKDITELPEVLSNKENGKHPGKDRDNSEAELGRKSCATCKQSCDPHLMVMCDTCNQSYHISCLDPPLARVPKKSSRWGWQCHECGKSSDSETTPAPPKEDSERPALCTSRSGRKIHPPKMMLMECSPNSGTKKRQS